MSRYVLAFCMVCGVATLGAQNAPNKEQSRLENCGVVLEEILNVPENIPQELIEKAECVVVIPSMVTVAGRRSGAPGAHPPCIRSMAAASGSRSAPKPPTSCFW
jgi:hypothetical protein